MITNRGHFGVITKRYAEPVPFPNPTSEPSVDPVQCPYDAAVIEPGVFIEITNQLPQRRISKGARVIPAEVGDLCIVQVRIEAGAERPILIVFEGIPFAEACPP